MGCVLSLDTRPSSLVPYQNRIHNGLTLLFYMISTMTEVIFQDLGLIDYQKSWNYQEFLFQKIIEQKLSQRHVESLNEQPTDDSGDSLSTTENYLLFCEHPPVITLGKSGNDSHLLMSEAWLREQGIQYFHINRGGDITYHGPGQVVGYPILNLDMFFTDIHKYLRLLEEVIIRTLDEFGIKGERLEKATGVWLDAHLPGKARKICAMGIRTSRWVTMHGFALNVNTNLEHFNLIVPCGLNDKQVTSLQNELGTKVDAELVKEILKKHFETLFKVRLASKTADLC